MKRKPDLKLSSGVDFIGECVEGSGLSISDFKRAFCDQCGQAKCARSALTKSKWSIRMARQLQHLNHPQFAPEMDEFRLALQDRGNFKTIEESVTVHLIDPPATDDRSGVVEAAVAALKNNRGDPTPEPVPETPLPEEPITEVVGPNPAPIQPKPKPQSNPTGTNTPDPGQITFNKKPTRIQRVKAAPGDTIRLPD